MKNKTLSRYRNTRVEVGLDGSIKVYLHGHLIAYISRCPDRVYLYSRGYKTYTTKKRLNEILRACDSFIRIWQERGIWYYADGFWRGRYLFTDGLFVGADYQAFCAHEGIEIERKKDEKSPI